MEIEARRLLMRATAQQAVQTARIALGAGLVSPALQDRIHRDILFFAGLDDLLEEAASLGGALREAVIDKAGDALVAWIADGGCSWLQLSRDGPGGLH